MKTTILKNRSKRKIKKRIIILGCGFSKPEGTIGIDIRPFKCVDYVLDIEKDKLPFKDDSVDRIDACHIFEHLGEGFLFCIDECFRVLKPKGILHIDVPCFPGKGSLIHPDHKRFFIPDSFGFFHVPSGGIDLHGYLKGFWHIDKINHDKENIICDMIPNKPKGRYPYKKIVRADKDMI